MMMIYLVKKKEAYGETRQLYIRQNVDGTFTIQHGFRKATFTAAQSILRFLNGNLAMD